ncbi:pyruvate, phosphate dikinase, chloroplastic [Tanacetum coccineum]
MKSDGTLNDDTPVVKEVVSPFMVDEIVAKEKQSPLGNTTNLGSYPQLPTKETTSANNALGGNGIDAVVFVESIRAISERFVNIAYGFFLVKRVAYPVIANYVRNTWGKYGLFIRNNPLILKKWHPDANLLKEDVGIVPLWVKLYGVLVTAFNEDGLSAISTKIAFDDHIYLMYSLFVKYINEDFEGKRTIDTLMDHVPVIDLSDDDLDLPSIQKRNVNNDENVITKDDVRLISSDYEELFPCTERKLSEEDTKKNENMEVEQVFDVESKDDSQDVHGITQKTTYNLTYSEETEDDFKVDYDSNNSFINDGSVR